MVGDPFTVQQLGLTHRMISFPEIIFNNKIFRIKQPIYFLQTSFGTILKPWGWGWSQKETNTIFWKFHTWSMSSKQQSESKSENVDRSGCKEGFKCKVVNKQHQIPMGEL